MTAESIRDRPGKVGRAALPCLLTSMALVILFAAAAGFHSFMAQQFSEYGRGAVVVLPRVTSSRFPGFRSGVRVRFAMRDIQGVEAESRDAVRALLPEYQSSEPLLVEGAGVHLRADVTGVDTRFFALRNFEIERGASFLTGDAGTAAVLIGAELAEDLFGGAERSVGRTIRIEHKPFEVRGVFRRKGRQYTNPSRPDNRLVVVTAETAEARLGFSEEQVTQISVYPREGVDPEGALRRVLVSLGPRSGFHPDDEGAVSWYDTGRLARLSAAIAFGLTVFLGLTGTVMLAIGGVAIANHQIATIEERRRELAVARAVGARRRDLVILVSLESVIVSAGAALAGLACGAVLGAGALSLLPVAAPSPPAPLGVMVALIVLPVVSVATFSAAVPGVIVSRIQVAEAVRVAV